MTESILFIYLIVLAVFDWREKQVPLILPVLGLAAAVLSRIYLMCRNPEEWNWILVSALLGILPGLLMLAVAWITKRAGCGDGLVLLNIGLLTDYKSCILLLCCSMLLMSAFCAVMLLLKRAGKDTRLPYLPFLTVVYAIEMAMRC